MLREEKRNLGKNMIIQCKRAGKYNHINSNKIKPLETFIHIVFPPFCAFEAGKLFYLSFSHWSTGVDFYRGKLGLAKGGWFCRCYARGICVQRQIGPIQTHKDKLK
jgi:hypothetical protein